jgi:hypothetical protein
MFKLNIECTRDIDELHINFSDGTSTIVDRNKNQETKGRDFQTGQTSEGFTDSVHRTSKEVSSVERSETYLDVDTDFGGISQDVIKPPEIERKDLGVKVADELQNFDF